MRIARSLLALALALPFVTLTGCRRNRTSDEESAEPQAAANEPAAAAEPAPAPEPAAPPVQQPIQPRPVARRLPTPPRRPVIGHDGCRAQYQACRCSNTGWRGKCNTGPHKAGLYCRCD
jgi:hypothetical protein